MRACNAATCLTSWRSAGRTGELATVATRHTNTCTPLHARLSAAAAGAQSLPPPPRRARRPREAHLAGAQAKLAAGKLVMAGASGDPVEGALFVFKNSSKAEIEAFVAADPYVQNGLVPSWTIKPYAVVVREP